MKIFTKIRRWLERLPKIGDVFYWLRTHTYNRYHMLDCRSPRNGYDWGWKDRDSLVLLANMAILKAFMEQESSSIDWKATTHHQEAYKEMSEILEWWNATRKQEHDAYDALLTKYYGGDDITVFEPCKDNPGFSRLVFLKDGDPEWKDGCKKCQEMEDALEQKDEDMLIRLIKVRGNMWS